MIRSIVEDEDLFPIFVSLGYDVFGLSEPLYWTEGLTINPNGTIDYEEDLEDMLNEIKGSDSARESTDNQGLDQRDFLDRNDDIDFSESEVAKYVQSFSENTEYTLSVTNSVNFALISLLDTIDPDHVNERTLINAAIDAGRFANKQLKRSSLDFNESEYISDDDSYEILDSLIEDYGLHHNATFVALGRELPRGMLKEGLMRSKQLIDTYELNAPDTVKTINYATGLTGEDLARSAIRLKCGKILYNSLPEAAIISNLAFNYGT